MIFKIYNSYNRKKEVFKPISEKLIKMYVCGPTVYNDPHIGNARPAVVFDVLYRLLNLLYPNVNYLRNITDIDDKINKEAQKLDTTIDVISNKYTKSYHEDMYALNVLEPTHEPRATDHINEIINMIQDLIDKDHAYEAEAHILFNVKSFKQYGGLSNRNLKEMVAGARVEVAPYKKNSHDFVLWKPSSSDLPGWDSPWGRGRPGWHIECSAMINKHLGSSIDIHGGGQDLIFPHHENEIAQSCCFNDNKSFVNYWIHNGYLQIEGEKMSKSLGNILTVKDLTKQYDGEVIRLALLSTHYRKPINFSFSLLNQTKNVLDKLYRLVESSEFVIPKDFSINDIDHDVLSALCDDLNTPLAISKLLKLKDPEQLYKSANILGILKNRPNEWFSSLKESTISVKEIEEMIRDRNLARERKDYKKADLIRNQLLEENIVLEDKGSETIWKHK